MKPDEVKKPTLQDLLERDKDKIAELAKVKEGTSVDPEDELLSEFGLYFGWEGVWAIKTNAITSNDMHTLILGARKVNAAHRYNKVIDMAVAFAGGKPLEQRLREIRKT